MATTILLEGRVQPLESGAQIVITKPTEHHVLWLRPTTKERPGAAYTVAPPDPFEPWTVQRLYWSAVHGAFTDALAAEVRDQNAALMQHMATDGEVYATLAWGATPEDLLILCWRPTHSMVEGWSSSNQPGSVYDKIEAHLPGFMAASGIRLKAKAKLLARVNSMDSLSELEKQVDLGSLLLIDLYERVVPLEERAPWFERFKEVVTACDSSAGKGALASLQDIEDQKIAVRELILAYYQERQQAGGA